MRWLRLLYAMASASRRRRISPADESRITFRVWPTDVDAEVMNHASMMTAMEMGRIDFMVRSGFFRLARQRGWYFPSRSMNVQFLRPLKAFQKAELITTVLHIDHRWIYTGQKIIRSGKDIALCVTKSTVKAGRQSVSPHAIAKELGLESPPSEGGDIFRTLEEGEHLIYQRLASR